MTTPPKQDSADLLGKFDTQKKREYVKRPKTYREMTDEELHTQATADIDRFVEGADLEKELSCDKYGETQMKCAMKSKMMRDVEKLADKPDRTPLEEQQYHCINRSKVIEKLDKVAVRRRAHEPYRNKLSELKKDPAYNRGAVLVQHEKNAPSIFHPELDEYGNVKRDSSGKMIGKNKKDRKKWIRESYDYIGRRSKQQGKIEREAPYAERVRVPVKDDRGRQVYHYPVERDAKGNIVIPTIKDAKGNIIPDTSKLRPATRLAPTSEHAVPPWRRYKRGQRTKSVKKTYATGKVAIKKSVVRKPTVKKTTVKKPTVVRKPPIKTPVTKKPITRKPIVRKLKSPKPVMWKPTMKKMAVGKTRAKKPVTKKRKN